MHPYGSPTHCVLHVDVDSFFCQVEELRCPSLAGRPLAIQQHQDVIAVNYPGRAAGVKKHMPPAQARMLLSAAGGLLVHVFTEPDGRVSYRPYREASAALMRLLFSGLPPAAASCVAVVEKASIDEAYLLVAGGQGAGQQFAAQGLGGSTGVALPDMPAWLAANAAATWDCSLGADMAAAVRAAAKAQLGLTVSVGVAPNKLLAKLASRAAKPDGVHVVGGVAAVQALLAATPVDKLPGLGGVAPALQRLGITTAQQLQGHSATSLASLLGGQQQARLAGRLAEAGWGRDEARVVDKGPAKSLQVQMTLTPQMRPLPPNLQAAGRGPIAGQASNAAGGGMLVPLLTGAADTAPRLAAVLGAMAGDLLGRVMLDRHVEDRWPRKLALTLTTSGNPPRSATRSTTFPTPALAAAAAAAAAPAPAAAATNSPAKVAAGINGGGVSGAGAKGAAQAPAAPAAAFDAPGVVGEKRYAAGSALHAAVVNLAAGLAQVLVAPLPAGHPVTILNLTASNFGPYEAAAASGSIRRFTTAAAGPPPAAVAAAVEAAATAPAAALPFAAPAAPQNDTAPSVAVSLPRQAHAATTQQQQLLQTELQSLQQEQQPHQQQARQQIEDDDGVLVEQQAASAAGVGAAAAQGNILPAQLNKPQQYQQQQQQPLHGPSVAAAATQRRPKRKLAAAYDTTAAAPVQLDEPPVLLSDLLRQLASPRLSAAAAERQLAALLVAAGGLGRLMPQQGEGPL